MKLDSDSERKFEKVFNERAKCVDAVLASASNKKVVVAGPGTGKTHLFKKILAGKKKTLTLTFVNSLVEDLSLELCGLSEVRTLHAYHLKRTFPKSKRDSIRPRWRNLTHAAGPGRFFRRLFSHPSAKYSAGRIIIVEDGTLEIDNNLIENAIRPSALGKKNCLFVGHPEAGERSAVIYTLLGSCRRQGINPFNYLKDLFKRLPAAKITQIREFTPAAWAETNVEVVAHGA